MKKKSPPVPHLLQAQQAPALVNVISGVVMPRQSTNDEAQLQEQPRVDYIDEVERWPAWLGKK